MGGKLGAERREGKQGQRSSTESRAKQREMKRFGEIKIFTMTRC